MSKHKIKYYPVGNGDMSLISLKSKATILVDCNIRANSSDNMENPEEVKDDLLKSIQRNEEEQPFVDVFTLSHPDKDHCGGAKKHFYFGKPEDYPELEEEDVELIVLNELWVTRRLFRGDLSKDADKIRQEANRRKKLYDDEDDSKNDDGNRLVIIGYDGEEKFDDVPHYYPGKFYSEIGGEEQKDFEVFIHAPLKEDVVSSSSDSEKNFTSIIFQARFFENETAKNNKEYSVRVIFGGDADHYIWDKVLEKTKKNNREHTLEWDLLLAPHHCSWSFFNNTPYNDEDKPENKIPQEYSLEFLDYMQTGSKVIASSNVIEEAKPNPPHQAAKDEYVKKVGKSNFLNTAIEPNEKNPKPIEFVITKNGVAKAPSKKIKDAAAAAGGLGAASTVVTSG